MPGAKWGMLPLGAPDIRTLSNPGCWELRPTHVCPGMSATAMRLSLLGPGSAPTVRPSAGGMGLRSRELPAAQEWAGALPGPPSAECLSGRELHCAERCVHQVVGDLSVSRQETQPQRFVWGWALLPTLFKPLWCSKSEGPAERRLGLFFIQQRDQIFCIPGVFPESLAGLPLLMFQVSAQMSSTQRQRPWLPSTCRQPPQSPPVCPLLVSSWYPPLSVVTSVLLSFLTVHLPLCVECFPGTHWKGETNVNF